MLSSDDFARMQADLAAIRGDREESITIRRGETTLTAQSVRIARIVSRGAERVSEGGRASTGTVVVLGSTTLDVQPGDRFNDSGGTLYEVVFIRPNRAAAVIAEARAVE